MAAEKNVTLAAISCRDTWKERERGEGGKGREEGGFVAETPAKAMPQVAGAL